MLKHWPLILLPIFLFIQCTKEDASKPDKNRVSPLEWQTGKNAYMMEVDSVERQYIIHVPANYDSTRPTPLVFMFHGSGGTGEKMYNVTEWVAKSEEVGCIVVFPTALEYFVLSKNGEQTKWSKLNLVALLPPGTKVKDDVPFVKAMLEKVEATFNIDKARIFATGFSNGEGFCRTRLALEMDDVFASITGAGGWGGPFAMRDIHPETVLSQYYILGNRDPKVLEGLQRKKPIPMDAKGFFEIENGALKFQVENVTLANRFDFEYSEESNANHTRIHFQKMDGVESKEQLTFHLIKGMLHKYPKPSNNPAGVSGVKIFWDFHMKHIKER